MNTWNIKKLLIYPNYYGKTDLEVFVYYTISNSKGVVYYNFATVILTQDDNFILKDSLVEQILIEKLKSTLGESEVLNLESQFNEESPVIDMPTENLI